MWAYKRRAFPATCSIDQSRYCRSTYIEHSGQFKRIADQVRRSFVIVSNIKNIFVCQFSFRTSFSKSETSFIGRIAHIICPSPEKQMRRSNTVPYITFMANAKSFWNWTIFKKPRESMGSKTDPFFSFELSIPIYGINGGIPKPTGGCFIYMCKETFGKIFTHVKEVLSCAIPPDAQTSRGFFVV
jgi:hypothetical protein